MFSVITITIFYNKIMKYFVSTFLWEEEKLTLYIMYWLKALNHSFASGWVRIVTWTCQRKDTFHPFNNFFSVAAPNHQSSISRFNKKYLFPFPFSPFPLWYFRHDEYSHWTLKMPFRHVSTQFHSDNIESFLQTRMYRDTHLLTLSHISWHQIY